MKKRTKIFRWLLPISLLVVTFLAAGIVSALPTDDYFGYFPIIHHEISNFPPTPEPTPPSPAPTPPPGSNGDWAMVAGNPQRTSWTPEEVTGNLQVEWYRPIEAYIPQNAHLIAANGLIYVSTARGLYALNAANGTLAWRFNTELPLGNSPTIADGIAYVGGFDKKLHALNAMTGEHLWAFNGADAGFDTNPLVVDDKVIAGNRDGRLYAIGAHGTPQQGQLVWQFDAGAPIHLSAAYANGTVYFAANNNYAYAVNVDDGSLQWQSSKLPGDGYQSYWPVIYGDLVVFAAAHGYRIGNPGTRSVENAEGDGYGQFHYMERDDIFANESDGTVLGPEVPNQDWGHGYPVIDASRITEYHEDNPNPAPHTHKPWRRMMIALHRSNGSEFTFDSDGDGHREYLPFSYWHTQSGNVYPPIVGPDGILYANNIYEKLFISQGRVMGWNPSTPSFLSVLRGQGAVDEPQALSAGGNAIYRNLCCDRVGGWFSITERGTNGSLWAYHSPLFEQAPGYDTMWWGPSLNNPDRLHVCYGNGNCVYGSHGAQAPLIPYQGRVFAHRSNAIIAYGQGAGAGQLPLLTISPAEDNVETPSTAELTARLENEVQKIIDAGHLIPGYYNQGQFGYNGLTDYFDNPGDTLYVLTLAHPHLSPVLQEQTEAYLRDQFETYFNPNMYARIGWNSGAARAAVPLPPEVQSSLNEMGPRVRSRGHTWTYPPHNFYAMWKYAQLFPDSARTAYDLAKGRLQVPVPDAADDQHLAERTYEHNAYIAGYTGFLELQELAGMAQTDSQLRNEVSAELNRLLQLRVDNFEIDSPWTGDQYWHQRHLTVARNFMWLIPELGDHMRQNLLGQVQQAMEEYNFVAPYWFVSRYEAVMDEGSRSNLYNYHALFLAKAYILQENRSELIKYLDVPAFERGDLFYIQNLVATIEAEP